ncbi:MAG: peptidase [Thermoanaerobaculia bacterium]
MADQERIPQVCVDMELPVELQVEAAERAIVENPSNVPVFRHHPALGVATSPLTMALVTGKKWKNGRTLHARFLAGDPVVQAKVKRHAVEWCDYASLGIVFDDSPNPEIRISFGNSGSWSYIGTDNLSIAPDKPTMNYGWLKPDTPDGEYSRVVLHEFGHALGCIHEHQHPGANIPWDREAAYRYYQRTNGWDRAKVDLNVFQRYDQSQTQFSQFDRNSIMEYPVDESLTLGNFSIGWNRELSDTDKTFIASSYPKDRPADAFKDLTLGATVQADIGKHGEEDLYRLAIAQDGTYTIETTGLTDVVMALLGPDSQTHLLASDDDSGFWRNAKIRTHLAPGTYWVRIRHVKPTGTGKYGLSARAA